MTDNRVADDRQLKEAAERLAATLRSRRMHLATAESCTGGWIAKVCTDLAGSSDWFDRGFVTYSNAAKQESIAVSAESIEAFGAVSEEVAAEMAQGALEAAGVDLAIAVTGVAGPGCSENKPAGLVWFGFALEGRAGVTECISFQGDREQVRRQTVLHALERAAQLLD